VQATNLGRLLNYSSWAHRHALYHTLQYPLNPCLAVYTIPHPAAITQLDCEIQVPNGELTAEQARFLGGAVRKYGEKGCLDITTRANIQLRGVPLEDAGDIMNGLQDVGLTSVQTGKHSLPMSFYIHADGLQGT